MNLSQLKNKNFYIMVLVDISLFVFALFGAYLVRFDFIINDRDLHQIIYLMCWIIPIKTICFFSFGLYKGMWRYSSINDMWKLLKATFFSSLIIVSVLLYVCHFHGYSRGVFLIDAMLTFILTGAFRLGVRFLYNKGFIFKQEGNSRFYGLNKKKSTVIIGAGDAGEMALREILNNPFSRYEVVGFVDDDITKKGRSIHGITVLGTIDELPRIVKEFTVEQLLIAIPSATGPQMRRIVSICESCEVPYKTLPGLTELIDGKVSVKTIRDVNYEDLLRRPPVKIEESTISEYLKNKKVLITGAGGSIGAELCRQVVKFGPKSMILLDVSEQNLYEIHTELEFRFGYKNYHAILGNVQYRPVAEGIINIHRPNVVIHAAAYKHVPMMETNPWEAIFNNIVGSRNIMRASIKYGVERFVMVSTDKAVRPTNVMGASKRVCELIMQSLNGENGTKMMCVRFGNVIGSSGSVIPLFRKQIEHGGPVTVTHPEVTRYFMTIPEACQLILQAGAMGEGGEIFILEMGDPIKIIDIANDLIKLSGKEPGRDIEIIFTGLRPGEKLYEELITEGEGIIKTTHKKIMVLRADHMWRNHTNKNSFKYWLDSKIDDLIEAAKKHESKLIKHILKEIVPEYKPNKL